MPLTGRPSSNWPAISRLVSDSISQAGGAGDINLGKKVADHLEANKVEPRSLSVGPTGTRPLITLSKRLNPPGPACSKVPTTFAGQQDRARQYGTTSPLTSSMRLSPSVISGRYCCADGFLSGVGECLENDTDIGIIELCPKDGLTTHPVNGLKMTSLYCSETP